jgi:hypothetical protein
MKRKQISNGQIGWTQAATDRRTVVLDIETVALDPTRRKKLALNDWQLFVDSGVETSAESVAEVSRT